jgi:hypothetical protein
MLQSMLAVRSSDPVQSSALRALCARRTLALRTRRGGGAQRSSEARTQRNPRNRGRILLAGTVPILQDSQLLFRSPTKALPIAKLCGRRETEIETRSCVSCQDWISSGLGTQGRSGRRSCCRFGASSRSCCCWFFFSSARWSIGSGRGGMDGNFGPQERILWPASVLAGIVMCGAVSFPRLAPPCFSFFPAFH